MKHSVFNIVRGHRNEGALCSDELATLIGIKSHTSISQYESGDTRPSLEHAFALQIVFGKEVRELFPGLFEGVEEGVMIRAREFLVLLEGLTDPWSRRKRELLEAIPRHVWGKDIEL